jgi:hypothetical protein
VVDTRSQSKRTIHVSMTVEALDLLDAIAREDAAPGDKPDRSRTLRKMVGDESARRTSTEQDTQKGWRRR